jgi:hypothetical protein
MTDTADLDNFIGGVNEEEPVIGDPKLECSSCSRNSSSASQLGAELRLMASQTDAPAVLPPPIFDKIHSTERPGWLAFLKARMLVPRFAVIMACVSRLSR